ncbi:hypothetical protein D3C85_1537200 [compost metagenome]
MAEATAVMMAKMITGASVSHKPNRAIVVYSDFLPLIPKTTDRSNRMAGKAYRG